MPSFGGSWLLTDEAQYAVVLQAVIHKPLVCVWANYILRTLTFCSKEAGYFPGDIFFLFLATLAKPLDLEMLPDCCSPGKEEPVVSRPVFKLGCGLHWVPLMFLYHCQRLLVHPRLLMRGEEVEFLKFSPVMVFFLPWERTALTCSPEGGSTWWFLIWGK